MRRAARALAGLVVAAVGASPTGVARAAETGGCDRFAWDLGAERTLLDRAAPAASGTEFGGMPAALVLGLGETAALPTPPERAPRRRPAFQGYATVVVPAAGTYRVTLSAEAWIDAVQDGRFIKPEAFTGIQDCPGARKSVKFRAEPGPLVVQVSGAATDRVGVAVTPDR